ncbi:MAG: hypothetical protein ABI969_06500 [bacterium]
MSDERSFGELWLEMERVGIDPHAFPAGVDVSHEIALRILRVLPDGAGPESFLTAIREEQFLRVTGVSFPT